MGLVGLNASFGVPCVRQSPDQWTNISWSISQTIISWNIHIISWNLPYSSSLPELARLRATSKLNMSNTWPRGGGYQTPINRQSPASDLGKRGTHRMGSREDRANCFVVPVHRHMSIMFAPSLYVITTVWQNWFFIITSFSLWLANY